MSKITIKFWDATSDTDASAPDSVKHPSHAEIKSAIMPWAVKSHRAMDLGLSTEGEA